MAKSLQLASRKRRGRESTDEGAQAERCREEPEALGADVQRVGGEERHEDVEVEADCRDHRDDGQDEAQLRVAPGEAGSTTDSSDDRRSAILRDREQLFFSDDREGSEDGEEAEGVQDEAESCSDCRDHEAGDRRPDDARAVEEPRVERDGVR